EFIALQDRQAAHEMFGAAAPNRFQPQILAGQELVGVDVDRTHIDKVADLDKCAIALDVAQAFWYCGQKTGAFKDHICACPALCLGQDDCAAIFDGGNIVDVDNHIRTHASGKLKPPRGASNDDDLGCAGDARTDEGNE